jgi:hypothetical protein
MIGARDLAFPRLNAFGFWLSALGGLLLYFSFIGGEGMAGAGSAPDGRLVRLRSAHGEGILQRPQHRLLDPWPDGQWFRFHCHSGKRFSPPYCVCAVGA